MKTQNRKLVFSFIIVLASLIIVDVIAGIIGNYAMHKLPDYAGVSGQIAKDNYRLNRLTTDIVIIGSSRGSHHYVATMLRDSINNYTGGDYTIFNAAIEGKFINSNSCAAESIMDRYAPKLLVFEVFEAEFSSAHAERNLEFSAVNYNDNRFVKRYLDGLGWKERVKLTSNMFRYNRKVANIAASFLRKTEGTGYEPLYKKMTIIPEANSSGKSESREIKEYSLRNFTRVLQTARDKGILLVIASSPRFSPTDNNMFLAELCQEYSIPYIELYDLDFFNAHPEYFQDADHLNDNGAHIYTGLFFDQLKPYLTPLMQNASVQ